MNEMKLSQASQLLNGQHRGADVSFAFVSMDTRTLKPGSLYIARKGYEFDGHNFLAEAEANGAIAALVQQKVNTSLPTLQVADTTEALGRLAAFRRQQYAIPFVAVTGSCGKTTTKSMLAAILQQKGNVLAPEKSFNNAVGLPLTLLNLTAAHKFGVNEIGANHFGEIAYLTKIACPNVAIITTIAPVHLEGFGDLAGVAKAKSEIFQGLPKNGIAVLNADDPFFTYLKSQAGQHQVITFAMHDTAQVYANNVRTNSSGQTTFTLHLAQQSAEITLPILGQHHVLNALAAAAGTYALGFTLAEIKRGLETVAPTDKRMIKRSSTSGATILDDTYNANPVAVEAALKLLQQFPGEKVLLFADMAELGKKAADYHIAVGQQARQYGVTHLLAVGELSKNTVAHFGPGAKHFADKKQLITAAKQLLKAGMVVLIKGSRSGRMEEVVLALTEEH